MVVSPWLIVGLLLVMAPIFIFMTARNISNQKQNMTRLLLERGATLLYACEAGARIGLISLNWNVDTVHQMFTEMSDQPNVLYIMVAENSGKIFSQSEGYDFKSDHFTGLDLRNVGGTPQWRHARGPDGKNIFEVYKKLPLSKELIMQLRTPQEYKQWLTPQMFPDEGGERLEYITFVGLDMEAIENMRRQHAGQTITMAITLFLGGVLGVISLLIAQEYALSRSSLMKIKALSDNLVEHMPVGLLSLDHNDRISALNQTSETLLGLVSEDVVGEKFDAVLPDELVAIVDELDGGVKDIMTREVECLTAAGNYLPLELSASVLEGDEGEFLGHVLLMRDLREIRRLQKEVERSERLAALGSLAAGIAHEIRNPLSSIKGFATYFKERYREIPEDKQTAEIMILEVERLNRVVGELLEFARPMNLKTKQANLKEIIRHSIGMVHAQAEHKSIEIRVKLPSLDVFAHVDSDRVSQVLLNLYLNAIDAMETGGVLNIRLENSNEGAVITVRDNGCGIKKDDIGRIFDPYFTTKPSGTGLGLAIVYKIIEAHGCKIKVVSEPGRGTAISVVMPTEKGA